MKTDIEALVQECYRDPALFSTIFFPSAVRGAVPDFHRRIWTVLTDPNVSRVALKVFRGGAKTTLIRLLLAYRIAYGLSRTVLVISNTGTHAEKTLEWIKKAVAPGDNGTEVSDPHSFLYSQTFGLSKGSKWTDDEIRIGHGVLGHEVAVVSRGFTGQLRGFNVDNRRPDLIICDDIEGEENTATPEQREKVADLFLGAVTMSLAPAEGEIRPLIAFLQTPLHRDSLIEKLVQKDSWHPQVFPKLDENDESVWPDMYPTAEVRQEREDMIQDMRGHIFERECMVRIVSVAQAHFRADWLRFWQEIPPGAAYFIGIDPAPVLDREKIGTAAAARKDYQAVAVIALHGRDIYLVEYAQSKLQSKDELVSEVLRLQSKYAPRCVTVETVAYQATLAEDLTRAKHQSGRFFMIHEYKPKGKKADRIVSSLKSRASSGNLWCHSSHIEFINDFRDYPQVSHDDLLDSIAIAMTGINPGEEFGASDLIAPIPVTTQAIPIPLPY